MKSFYFCLVLVAVIWLFASGAVAVNWVTILAAIWVTPLVIGLPTAVYRGVFRRDPGPGASGESLQSRFDAKSRFQQVYLRIANDVSAEEEALADLYARGGGTGVFVERGWFGRRAEARAAVWFKEMEKWLRENPEASKDDQTVQSRRLLERFGLLVKLG
jgi:hypothetical protein